MHKFTKLILDEYNRQGIKITDQNESAAYVSPLVELSDAQKDILSKGDGQKPNQYKQINSSTGLAVNYYKREFEIIFKKVKSRKTSNLQRVAIKWSPVKIM